MSGYTINRQCHSCGAWINVAGIQYHPTDGTLDRCQECGGFTDEQFDDLAQQPCSECGTLVRWPAGDAFDILCRPCLRKIIEAA